jgi:hypothetical protein
MYRPTFHCPKQNDFPLNKFSLHSPSCYPPILFARILVTIIMWHLPPSTGTFCFLLVSVGDWWNNFSFNLTIFKTPMYKNNCLPTFFLANYISSPFSNLYAPLIPFSISFCSSFTSSSRQVSVCQSVCLYSFKFTKIINHFLWNYKFYFNWIYPKFVLSIYFHQSYLCIAHLDS